MEHTLQQQMAAQYQEMIEMKTQMAELTALLKGQLAIAAPSGSPPAATIAIQTAGAAVVNTGPVTNNTVQQVININPWDGGRRISVSPLQIAAAFAENARLREYMSYGDHKQMLDPEIAPPYVTELLMDLVKRAHAVDASARNVYLNPRRADQVLVHMKSGRWEVMPLAEATRLLFDGVAETIHEVVLSYAEMKALPLEAQNALAMAGMLYEGEPDAYVKRAKGPMSAHLTNLAPSARPTPDLPAPKIG